MKRTGTFTVQGLGRRTLIANVPTGESINVYLINSDGDEVLADRFIGPVYGEANLHLPTKFVCSANAELEII